MNTGIYKITNLVNNKFYIGSSSYNVYNRINVHKRLLKQNKHENSYLQKSYNKHGLNNFNFEIVELCEPLLCLEREQYYLDFFKCYNRDIGYNINKKSNSRLGCILSQETKDKISNSHKGKIISNETKRKLSISRNNRKIPKEIIEKIRKSNFKKVLQYSLSGEFIKEWESLKSVEEIFGKGVGNCVRGRDKTAYKYIWKYRT